MPQEYTVEVSYMLPVYKHLTVVAESFEEACQIAVDHDNWDNAKEDYDSSRPTFVSGVWSGDRAYYGHEFRVPPKFQEQPF